MLGHHWHASETPFKWRADDGLLIVVFGSSLQLKKKGNTVKSWTPSDEIFLDPCMPHAYIRCEFTSHIKLEFRVYSVTNTHNINSLHGCCEIFHDFCSSLIFFKIDFFEKILFGIHVPSECPTGWIQIRVQTVCKGYQQTTLEGKRFTETCSFTSKFIPFVIILAFTL